MDYSALIAAADFSDCAQALLSIAGFVAAYQVVGWGARKVLDFIEGPEAGHHGSEPDSGFREEPF